MVDHLAARTEELKPTPETADPKRAEVLSAVKAVKVAAEAHTDAFCPKKQKLMEGIIAGLLSDENGANLLADLLDKTKDDLNASFWFESIVALRAKTLVEDDITAELCGELAQKILDECNGADCLNTTLFSLYMEG